MPLPPKKPSKKKQLNPGEALRRRLSSDGFQAVPAPSQAFETQSAEMDRSKAVAGIMKRLVSTSRVPPEVELELMRLARSISGDEWQLLQRIVLAGPAPTTSQQAELESRRFAHELDGPLARLANSYHLRLVRERGAPLSDLLRGSDIILIDGGRIFQRLAEINTAGSSAPFPGTRMAKLPSFGTLQFARHGQMDLVVRLEAPLAQMRALAPSLMRFFEEQLAKGQNVGPMGCSPRTLRSGKAVATFCD